MEPIKAASLQNFKYTQNLQSDSSLGNNIGSQIPQISLSDLPTPNDWEKQWWAPQKIQFKVLF